MPVIHRADQLLDRTAELLRAARSAGVPVIFLHHDGTPDSPFAAGTERARIHPSIAPLPAEAVIHKTESSGFDGTELQEHLNERGVDSIIACGLQSEFCVSNTCLAALDLGFNVYVAEDGHSTWPTDDNGAAAIIERQNAMLSERGALLQTTATMVHGLAGLGRGQST